MNFQKFYLILISAICVSFAACNSGSGASNGSNDSSGSNGSSNVTSGDTTSIVGTIESVSLRDSMIVFNTDKGLDTVFYNSNTKFNLGDPGKVLRPQTRIDVRYVTIDRRKVAVTVQPAATGAENKKK